MERKMPCILTPYVETKNADCIEVESTRMVTGAEGEEG
jgi:hypothetical protein